MFLSLTILQVLFWLMDVGISMHVCKDLGNLLTEIRYLDSLLTEMSIL
jgi:hypothetical protein